MKGLLVNVFILFVFVVLLTSCSSGTAVVVGERRTSISSDQVRLYLTPPKNYEVVGLVDASDDTGWTPAGSQENAIEELKNQAAKLGANGVLLVDTGTINSTMMGNPWITKTASGQAIYVYQDERQARPPASSIEPVSTSSGNPPPPVRKWKKPVQ